MRVIAGIRKGAALFGPEEYVGTRPISDRAKGGLFNILQGQVEGAAFLDLFAGTGGVGIEALSRGAAHATFVDLETLPVSLIRRNLEKTGFTRHSTVVQTDALRFLNKQAGSYDIAFIGPPQWLGLWRTSLEALDAKPAVLRPSGVAILQCDPTEYQQPALTHLDPFDQRKYGSVMLTFFRRKAPPAE